MIHKPKKKPSTVLILGMHRSGTSCLAGCLQYAGLRLEAAIENSPNQPKGSRENLKIRSLNNDIIMYSGGLWNKPPTPVCWSSEHKNIRDEIIKQFSALSPTPWGFKDPRTILTLPFWREKLSDVQYVATYRNPIAVSCSLLERNNIPIEEGLKIWLHYNMQLIKIIKKESVKLICFDLPDEKYEASLDKIIKSLKLPTKKELGKTTFYDGNFKNQNPTIPMKLFNMPKQVQLTYEQLNSIYRNQFARGYK